MALLTSTVVEILSQAPQALPHFAARSTAQLPALNIAYRAGIVASGDTLGKLPIIDSRGFDEQGIHYIWRSFVSER